MKRDVRDYEPPDPTTAGNNVGGVVPDVADPAAGAGVVLEGVLVELLVEPAGRSRRPDRRQRAGEDLDLVGPASVEPLGAAGLGSAVPERRGDEHGAPVRRACFSVRPGLKEVRSDAVDQAVRV